jgi:sugar O-acyltransferase (sialic acid O-acetyltransferase NeuD family)
MNKQTKELIIVGAGGLGREVYSWLSDFVCQSLLVEHKTTYHIKGFIDDNINALKGFDYDCGIIGTIKNHQPIENEFLVLAILHTKTKKNIVDNLTNKGASFFTLIHDSAVIGKNIFMGQGCVICPNVTITADVKLGDFVFINIGSTIGHDVVIGDFTSITPNVYICGKTNVGEMCTFGASSTIIPERKIGSGAFVGAGSVVIKNIKKNQKVYGNPASII